MHPIDIILTGVGLYAVVGVVFAFAFVCRGAGAIDPVAGRAPWWVRVVFAPGAAALWPLLAARWARVTGGRA